MPEYHFKENGDFVCTCGSTLHRPRMDGETMWRCNSCNAVYVQHDQPTAPIDDSRRHCAQCNAPMDYHEWPAICEWTGDHLGDYKLWHCKACDIKVDVSADA